MLKLRTLLELHVLIILIECIDFDCLEKTECMKIQAHTKSTHYLGNQCDIERLVNHHCFI